MRRARRGGRVELTSIGGLALLVACTPPYHPPAAETESSGSSTSGEGSSSSGSESESSSAESESGGECSVGEDCPAARPYCVDQSCVDCTAIGHSGCAGLDAQRPICNTENGLCVECTPTVSFACVGELPICVDGSCVACSSHEQCEAYCDLPTGQCDRLDLNLQVYDWEFASEPGMDVDIVVYETSQDIESLSDDDAGKVTFPDVRWDEVLDLRWRRSQNTPVIVSSTKAYVGWHTIMPASSEVELRLPYLLRSTHGRIAYECGLYESLSEATNGPLGLFNRSSLLVRLRPAPGQASAPPVDRNTIQLYLDDYPMPHGATDDEGYMDGFVCDIETQAGVRIGDGTNEMVGTEGWFVVFGLRDQNGSALGTVRVEVPGYHSAEFETVAKAAIDYVELQAL